MGIVMRVNSRKIKNIHDVEKELTNEGYVNLIDKHNKTSIWVISGTENIYAYINIKSIDRHNQEIYTDIIYLSQYEMTSLMIKNNIYKYNND
jgi:hypothetical protein